MISHIKSNLIDFFAPMIIPLWSVFFFCMLITHPILTISLDVLSLLYLLYTFKYDSIESTEK